MSTMPRPSDPEECARWDEQSLRLRLLTGQWPEDALQREADFFAPEVRAMLPPAETSRNAFKSCTEQVAILYDEEWIVSAKDTDSDLLSVVLTGTLLPLLQERHRIERGVNECFMRMDWEEGDTQVQYRVLAPCFVACVELDNKRNLTHLEELRLRSIGKKKQWTWEIWDVTDLTAPYWRIEAVDDKGVRVDVTADYSESTVYPYFDKQDKPIMPYVIAHSRIGSHTFDCNSGHELVIGTLTAAVLWTFWIGGVRDGAHPQRAVIDGVVEVTGAVNGQSVVRMNPQTILQIASKKIGDQVMHAAIAQWEPAMDPAQAGKAIQDFEAGLCVSAGLSPADVSGGSTGQSGYAIVVSRDGLRRYQKKAIPPARFADKQILCIAARLANRYGGAALPEVPDAWSIQYAPIQQSPDEMRAEAERVEKYISMRLMSRVQAVQSLFGLQHEAAEEWINEVDEAEKPETSDAMPDNADVAEEMDAIDEMLAVEGEADMPAIKASLAKIRATLSTGAVALAPASADPLAASSTPGGGTVKAADTALNGAQVQAATAIVAQVAGRLLPRESGVQQLVEFFNLDPAKADRIMGSVGKTFFVEPAP